MANPNPRKFTKKDQIEGGKKSKRGKSLKKMWEEISQVKIPASVLKELKKEDITVLSTTAGKALLLRICTEALKGEGWASKLIWEQDSGRAVQPIANDPENPLIFTLNKEEQNF